MNVLVVFADPLGLDGLARGLRSRGMIPVLSQHEHAAQIVSRWRPDAAVLIPCENGRQFASGWISLLRHLERERVPVVVVGSSEYLKMLEGSGRAAVAWVVPPLDADDVVAAAQAVAATGALADRPDHIEVGALRLDLVGEVAFRDGEALELPPKEFAILTELALEVGRPLSSAELIDRVWPRCASATPADVHRHVHRLRTLLGDQGPRRSLVENRRGFGYVLSSDGQAIA